LKQFGTSSFAIICDITKKLSSIDFQGRTCYIRTIPTENKKELAHLSNLFYVLFVTDLSFP